MNYIKHLTGFFEKIVPDEKLNPTHISLYIALFQYWNVNRFQNPISISRSEIMRISKISAKATYHKCMKELHELGYIKYQPSYNPFKGSLVHLMNFENIKSRPTRRQLMNQKQAGAKQAPVPYTNGSNNTNNSNEGGLRPGIPEQAEVEHFFKQNKFPLSEAKKFFSHYKAIGWKIQGITPITDWQALVEKWLANAAKFDNGKAAPASEQTVPDAADLFESFKAEKKIFHLITPAHFEELKLQLTEETIQEAWQERISQVTGTNQHSIIELWKAYLTGDPQNDLVQKDEPNRAALAKRIQVLKHFQQLKQSGSTCK
ncbi:MAG TPA: hypothetical protein VGO47_08890 [Chlamydiales bacterium]|jgi:hypothetical protein|nr:hypothetical protein [Chlamydiales bacterium]